MLGNLLSIAFPLGELKRGLTEKTFTYRPPAIARVAEKIKAYTVGTLTEAEITPHTLKQVAVGAVSPGLAVLRSITQKQTDVVTRNFNLQNALIEKQTTILELILDVLDKGILEKLSNLVGSSKSLSSNIMKLFGVLRAKRFLEEKGILQELSGISKAFQTLRRWPLFSKTFLKTLFLVSPVGAVTTGLALGHQPLQLLKELIFTRIAPLDVFVFRRISELLRKETYLLTSERELRRRPLFEWLNRKFASLGSSFVDTIKSKLTKYFLQELPERLKRGEAPVRGLLRRLALLTPEYRLIEATLTGKFWSMIYASIGRRLPTLYKLIEASKLIGYIAFKLSTSLIRLGAGLIRTGIDKLFPGLIQGIGQSLTKLWNKFIETRVGSFISRIFGPVARLFGIGRRERPTIFEPLIDLTKGMRESLLKLLGYSEELTSTTDVVSKYTSIIGEFFSKVIKIGFVPVKIATEQIRSIFASIKEPEVSEKIEELRKVSEEQQSLLGSILGKIKGTLERLYGEQKEAQQLKTLKEIAETLDDIRQSSKEVAKHERERRKEERKGFFAKIFSLLTSIGTTLWTSFIGLFKSLPTLLQNILPWLGRIGRRGKFALPLAAIGALGLEGIASPKEIFFGRKGEGFFSRVLSGAAEGALYGAIFGPKGMLVGAIAMAITRAVGPYIDDIKKWFSEKIKDFIEWASPIIDGIYNFFTSIKDFFAEKFRNITDKIGSLTSKIGVTLRARALPETVEKTASELLAKRIGAVSILHETGTTELTEAAKRIGKVPGDIGGVSYGMWQLASKKGALEEFLRWSGYKEHFRGLTPGTKEFDEKWVTLATIDPNFVKKQYEYGIAAYYLPGKRILESLGVRNIEQSRALQELIISRTIQQGVEGFKRLAENALGHLPPAVVSRYTPAQVVQLIYEELRRNPERYFKSAYKAGLGPSLAKRFEEEEAIVAQVAKTEVPTVIARAAERAESIELRKAELRAEETKMMLKEREAESRIPVTTVKVPPEKILEKPTANVAQASSINFMVNSPSVNSNWFGESLSVFNPVLNTRG